MGEEAEQITYAVSAASQLMHDREAEQKLEAHCRWELRAVLRRIQLSDLTAGETLALLAIVAPVHSRVIDANLIEDGADDIPVLRLIR